MRIASFFSGIGGLELGLEWAGFGPTVFQREQDAYATRVLERHWPGLQRHDDITTLDPADIPDAEVWCGGFPCTDISVAGKGAGLEGEHSGLWFNWLDLIRVVRPPVVVVENVAAFLGRGLGDVLGQLAEIGFDAEWSTLQAAEVGAPHRRDRVFVIAYLPDATNGRRGRSRTERQSIRQAVAGVHGAQGPLADAEREGQLQPQGRELDERGWAGDGGADLADAARAGQPELPGCEALAERAGDRAARGPGWWRAEPDVGRVAHGVPARVDRLRCLGNAVVPQCAYVVGLRLMQMLEERDA